jgi:hypothetical protein
MAKEVKIVCMVCVNCLNPKKIRTGVGNCHIIASYARLYLHSTPIIIVPAVFLDETSRKPLSSFSRNFIF